MGNEEKRSKVVELGGSVVGPYKVVMPDSSDLVMVGGDETSWAIFHQRFGKDDARHMLVFISPVQEMRSGNGFTMWGFDPDEIKTFADFLQELAYGE